MPLKIRTSGVSTNIHAKEYQLYLPSKELLRQKLIDCTVEQESKA
jgi:hypothetical protein